MYLDGGCELVITAMGRISATTSSRSRRTRVVRKGRAHTIADSQSKSILARPLESSPLASSLVEIQAAFQPLLSSKSSPHNPLPMQGFYTASLAARAGCVFHTRYNTSYVYDANSNRVKKYDSGALTQYSVNAANELLVITPPSGAATTQTFDPNGNTLTAVTGAAITTNTWTAENRLSKVAFSDGTSESYEYKNDGLRTKKVNGSGTTLFTWDEQNVLLETDNSLNLQARNTDYPGYWGGLASQRRGSTSSFYGYDSQGSARILVSQAGVITDSYSFKAFGEILNAGSGTLNPYLYVGLYGYYEDRANVYYVRARVNMALLGSWLSRVGFEQQLAGEVAYGYAINNPVTYIDPDGNTPQHQTSQGFGQFGTGNGCPGADAFKFLQTSVNNNIACAEAIGRVCPSGIASEFGMVPFITLPNCQPLNPKKPKSCMNYFPPGQNPPVGGGQSGMGSKCGSINICFNLATCGLPVNVRASLLLHEMINWCNCKYHNGHSNTKDPEQPAIDITLICSNPPNGLLPTSGRGGSTG